MDEPWLDRIVKWYIGLEDPVEIGSSMIWRSFWIILKIMILVGIILLIFSKLLDTSILTFSSFLIPSLLIFLILMLIEHNKTIGERLTEIEKRIEAKHKN